MYSNILWKFRTQKNFDQKEKRQKKQARKEEPQMIQKQQTQGLLEISTNYNTRP